jgi:hypothetical protein
MNAANFYCVIASELYTSGPCCLDWLGNEKLEVLEYKEMGGLYA